jgi:hypothetical protein
MTPWDPSAPPAAGGDPAAAFAAAYQREFGFVLARPVVVDDVRVRATGRSAALPEAKVRRRDKGLGAGAAPEAQAGGRLIWQQELSAARPCPAPQAMLLPLHHAGGAAGAGPPAAAARRGARLL